MWSNQWTFNHIYRENNKRADVIANAAAYSQQQGDQMARETGRLKRLIVKSLPEHHSTNHERICKLGATPKKMEISFPIKENYVPPYDHKATLANIGNEEDFREIKINNSKTISNNTITKFFKKRK
jgi:hypothetical protein